MKDQISIEILGFYIVYPSDIDFLIINSPAAIKIKDLTSWLVIEELLRKLMMAQN